MNDWKASGFLYLAVLGALIATLCDASHVYTQALSYPGPLCAGQAWWVFPGFLLAFSFMGVSYVVQARLCRQVMLVESSQSPGSAHAMVESLVVFVLVYLLSGFGNESPYLLALIFFGTFFIRLAVTYERGWALLLALSMAVGGMFVEGLLSLLGQVTYRHVDVFGVPYWLGGLYMHGALALRESARFFIYRQPAEQRVVRAAAGGLERAALQAVATSVPCTSDEPARRRKR